MAIAGATPHYSAVLRGAVETTNNNLCTIPRHARVCTAVTFCLATAIAPTAAGATPGATLRDDAVVFTQADLRGLGVTQTQQVLTTVIAAMTAPNFPVAMGVIYRDPAPAYEESVHAQIAELAEKSPPVSINELMRKGQTWTVV